MAKKPTLKDLMNNVPSPKNSSTRFIALLFALLMFSILIYVGSVTYTGLAISNLGSQQDVIIKNQNIFVSNRFEILDIEKTQNSVLDVNLKSNILLNVFAEINDCDYWKSGKDRDNTILYSVNNIKEGTFKIGNPGEKTMQQIDLYKADKLCLIFINREFSNTGNANIQYKEIDVNKWKII